MTAACLDDSASTVRFLTGERIDKVEIQVTRAVRKNWVAGLLSSILNVMLVNIWKRMAVKFTDDAIWFQGVAKEEWSENSDLGAWGKKTILRLEAMQRDLQSLRKNMLDASAGIKLSREGSTARTSAIASLAALFEAIEEFRWTLMELEANHSPRLEGYQASSPDEVAALFRSIE